jgi:hypothetical protein
MKKHWPEIWQRSKLKEWGVVFTRMRWGNEYEIQFPRHRSYGDGRLRVCVTKGNSKRHHYFSVARPGRGGTFHLSYNWIIGNARAEGFGFARIREKLRSNYLAMVEGMPMRPYPNGSAYLDMVASAINYARVDLLELIKNDDRKI